MSSAATVLDRIVAETRAEVARRAAARPLDAPAPRGRTAPAGAGGALQRALELPGVGVIAEFKRRSPSAGRLQESPQLAAILSAYERGGAVAASVLTEGPNFGGSLEDLRAAGDACSLPLLRKDFIVDPYQVAEASQAGADAILLIVAALAPAELSALHSLAVGLGLDVLVEVHDREELAAALDAGARLVGVNNRDLRDFSVDLARTESLMSGMPAGALVVSESGIASRAQVERLQELGVAGVLVGETLMRAPDPAAAVRMLRGEDGL